MLHMLVANGARWLPEDKRTLGYARRELLMMAPEYLLELIWILHRYKAARRSDGDELLRMPSVARLLGQNLAKAKQLVSELPEELTAAATRKEEPNQTVASDSSGQ